MHSIGSTRRLYLTILLNNSTGRPYSTTPLNDSTPRPYSTNSLPTKLTATNLRHLFRHFRCQFPFVLLQTNKTTTHQSTSQRNRDLRSCEVRISPTSGNFIKRWLASFPNRSKRIDVVSRICFPTMFGMFNVVYWTVYLLREDLRDNLIKK